MDTIFILNLVHRIELSPEYAEKLAEAGLAQEGVKDEALDIFRIQQEIAHRNGLKTTIQMTYASLFSDEAVALAKEHHEKYGDEIGLTLLGLPCREFNRKYKTREFCIWMFSLKDKKRIADDVFPLFRKRFGFYPRSTGSYYMDAELINYIKEKYPSVTAAVATCWEEGPKAYRTCNNSWYTFMDGGPWAPWIPSKENTHVPALGPENDSGIIAIPHLSRDLLACFDGNGSNFGTHPQNVLRGMIYEDGKYPYLFNLIDQYRYLGKFNDGIAYNMMFVGPGWMNKAGRWEAPYELLLKSYEDALAYYGKLKKENKLTDMTMDEFARFYRRHKTYAVPEVALWKDILYGSGKELFWYADPYFRFCLDMNQSGAMIDLRPYAARLNVPVGIGTKNVYDASYPYLIQANYRAGYFTHYAGEGTLKSAKISYQKETVDLALCRTKAKVETIGKKKVVTLDPVEVVFKNLKVTIRSEYSVEENTGIIATSRKIIGSSDKNAEVEITEYVTAAYGTTEYAEDMGKVILKLTGDKTKTIRYAYKDRLVTGTDIKQAEAVIPNVGTRMILSGSGNINGYIREGHAFSPMLTLAVSKTMKEQEEFTSWLKLEKAG